MNVGKFQLGIQPSRYDFLHSGYSLGGAYAPKLTTAALSYTARFGKNASFSLALEDPDRRVRQDGLLNRSASGRRPDLVGQIRLRHGATVFHLGAALTQIRDEIAQRYAEVEPRTTGKAAIVAFERRFQFKPEDGGKRLFGLGGRLYGSLSLAEGAIGYLGAPYFATDYIVDAEGNLDLSDGYSLVLSYENIWAPDLRSTFTLSHFATAMRHSAVLPSPEPLTGFDFTQELDATGYRASFGIEKRLKSSMRVGMEASWNWTRIKETANGYHSYPLSGDYPEVMIYAQRRF